MKGAGRRNERVARAPGWIDILSMNALRGEPLNERKCPLPVDRLRNRHACARHPVAINIRVKAVAAAFVAEQRRADFTA